MAGRSAIVLGLVWLLCASAAAQPPPDPPWLAPVEAALARGQPRSAIARLTRIVDQRPKDHAARARLIMLLTPDPESPVGLHRRQRDRDARQIMRRVNEVELMDLAISYSARRELRLRWAWADAWLGNTRDGVSRVLALSSGSPQSVLWLKNLAAVAVARGDLASAERALRAVYRWRDQDPNEAGPLALVALAAGKPRFAARLLSLKLAANDDLQTRRDLAAALMADGNPKQAQSVLESHADACAKTRGCTPELARAALEGDDPKTALEHLSRAAVNEVDGWLLRAEALVRLGDLAAAQDAYRRVLSIDPKHVRAQVALDAVRAALQDRRAP